MRRAGRHESLLRSGNPFAASAVRWANREHHFAELADCSESRKEYSAQCEECS